MIERIGGRQPITVDTRIVCGQPQNLEIMIATGGFREDSIYRLDEVVVKLPPGRARWRLSLLARHSSICSRVR